ncbi:MAG: hypothetical protein AAB655_01460 [Patescibacteria group bacterium]
MHATISRPLPYGGKRPPFLIKKRYFLVKILNGESPRNRLTVLIPKSSARKSSERNYWRRKIIGHGKSWPNAGGGFMVRVLPAIEGAKPKDVRPELDSVSEILNNKFRTTQ